MSPASEQTLLIADIDVGGLIRRPRPSRVAVIARAIAERGQVDTPIEVSPANVAGRYVLTCGWVRLEALKKLGHLQVRAIVVAGSRRERLQRQIDDNLVQDGCTVLDQAIYLSEGKALYEEAHPETRHGGTRSSGQVGDLKSYVAWACEQYGLAERSVQRACRIGATIDRVAARLIADTAWADHQQALEQIGRLSADHQGAVARLLTRQPEPVESVAEAIELVVGVAPAEPEKKRWSAALSNYASMGARQRADWLRHLVADSLVPNGVSIVFEGDG